MKNLLTCQEMITIQQEARQITRIIKCLSKQTNTTIPQQINFIGKLEEDNAAAMQQKSILNVSLDSLTVTE